jgi:hypothetical protein
MHPHLSLSTITWILVVWTALSIPFGICIGKWIKHNNGG